MIYSSKDAGGTGMDKTKLAEVIPVLIERLQAAPDGYDITTAQLMQVAGYRLEDFEFTDLFDVHFALFEAAEKADLTLDMSEHENKVEGLPFNLDFILRKQNQ